MFFDFWTLSRDFSLFDSCTKKAPPCFSDFLIHKTIQQQMAAVMLKMIPVFDTLFKKQIFTPASTIAIYIVRNEFISYHHDDKMCLLPKC